MLNRRLAALTLAAAMLLAGCGQAAIPTAGKTALASGVRVKAAADADFAIAARKAIELISKSKEYAKPRLVSIDGVGLDQSGKLVPLLGAAWTFRFWVTGEEGDYRVDVVQHVEGDMEIVEGNEGRETELIRTIDPAKLVPPTQLVPMAIKLGLKVSRQSASYNYFDITYNASYADPVVTETDVADVTSYYRTEQLDGFRLPATAGFFPAPAPAAGPAPVTPKPTKMTAEALSKAKRVHDATISF